MLIITSGHHYLLVFISEGSMMYLFLGNALILLVEQCEWHRSSDNLCHESQKFVSVRLGLTWSTAAN